jgi:TolA-binding protein
MRKHTAGLLVLLALTLSSLSCKKAPDPAALKAKEDAAWREKQRLQAAKYYSELIKNFPDSPNVEEAKTRLEALGPIATPAKK